MASSAAQQQHLNEENMLLNYQALETISLTSAHIMEKKKSDHSSDRRRQKREYHQFEENAGGFSTNPLQVQWHTQVETAPS